MAKAKGNQPAPADKSKKKVQPIFKPARFLDPKSDIVFKRIFGENLDLLKSFLNGVLPLSDDHLIETLEYLPVEQSPRIPNFKNTIVDVKCTDQAGQIFIVEMQLNWTANFAKRLLFGASKAYVQQIHKGSDYHSLCPVYGLGIINDTFEESEEWFHQYRIANTNHATKIIPGIELIFIELPKSKPQTFEHRKMGVLWLRFLNEIDDQVVDVPQEFMDNLDLVKAMELSQESAYSPAELEAYDHYWDAVRVEKTVAGDARREGKAEGIQEGLEKGIQEGLEKGIREGLQKGIQEGLEKGRYQEKMELARSMREKGYTRHQISELTGLDEKEIMTLFNS